MPPFNLTRGDDFDRLAPFKVLAVMCHPDDRVYREKTIALFQTETGEGPARRNVMDDEEFRQHIIQGSNKGGGAGSLLMARLQLHMNGHKPSLNRALPLAQALLPEHWPSDDPISFRHRSRVSMLKDYREFRSVAHLWAAAIHGIAYGDADLWRGSQRTLPKFLSYANAFLDLACALPDARAPHGFCMRRSEAWTFATPKPLVQTVRLEALPFTERQRRAVDYI